VLGSWDWLSPWTNHFIKERWQYHHGEIVLTSPDLIAANYLPQVKKEKKLLVLFIPFIVAIVFWFFTAPDWLFLGAILQLLIGLFGCIFIRFYAPRDILRFTEKFPPNIASSLAGIIVLVLMTKTAALKPFLYPNGMTFQGQK
jgi:hypothetical protein